MKQHTTDEQTAKLIELGFEKPKSTREMVLKGVIDGVICFAPEKAYSIGELIEMLPKTIEDSLLDDNLSIYTIFDGYQVEYSNILGETYFSFNVELIDALYEMVIKLKKENVI